MLEAETKQWLDKIFKSNSLSSVELKNAIAEMSEASDLTIGHFFLYELARRNSEAAFLFWQQDSQKRLERELNLKTGMNYGVSTLMPFCDSTRETLFLKNGEAWSVDVVVSDLAPAFHFMNWTQLTPKEKLFSIDAQKFRDIAAKDFFNLAVIVAGIKSKAYELAHLYAHERIQGGRLIKDWSLVQSSLVELHLNTKTDEALLEKPGMAQALSILRNADVHLSGCMQVMGGAGYMEDYIVERLYREVHFLKNWPSPFKEQFVNFYRLIHP